MKKKYFLDYKLGIFKRSERNFYDGFYFIPTNFYQFYD